MGQRRASKTAAVINSNVAGNVRKENNQEMRLLTLVILVFALRTTVTFGQDKPKTVTTYERNVIARPFFVRWIKDLTGPGFGQLEKLQLKSDNSFYYSYRDRYCGTFDNEGTGTWTIINDRLILKPNDNCLIPWTNLIIEKRKLYSSVDSLKSGTWAMKK